MDAIFMARLETLRVLFGAPIHINSAKRCETYNRIVRGGDASAHLQGRAVDVRIHGAAVPRLVANAYQVGFTGIGVRQSGPYDDRFIHLDDLAPDDPDHLRPWLWSYK